MTPSAKPMMRPEEQAERLAYLGSSLRRKYERQVSAKAEIEQRWVDDLYQYHGKYSRSIQAELDRDKTGSSKIYVNLTRPRCRSLRARICAMLFPSDDRNWEIKPTPNPEIAGFSQAANTALFDQIQALAKQRADGMQRTIDDQLTECHYQDVARDAINWAVLLGTGIIKGPIISARVEKTWNPLDASTYQLDMRLSHTPTAKCVSPLDLFPDMEAFKAQDAEFFFERSYTNATALRKLALNPIYRKDAIREVLRSAKRGNSNFDSNRQALREISGNTSQGFEDIPYELVEYNGALAKEDMEALGIDVVDDDLIVQPVTLEFVDNIVIRAELHPLETGDSLYSIFSLFEDESCIFGYGLPYILRSPQSVINAAWRMMLDNSAYAVGPQVVIRRESISPANGVMALQPRKLWFNEDMAGRAADAIASFNVDSHQPELMNIYLTAKQLIDEESQMPSIMQGEIGQTPIQTATGMSMLANNSNTILQEFAKSWDEKVTKPLIGRFYDYNMQYSDDPNIKGDFKIDPRGSSALTVKETQLPSLIQLAQLAEQPSFAPVAKAPEIFRAIVETLRFPPGRLAKTDDEIKAEQSQQTSQVDPGMAMEANAMQQKAETDAAQRSADYQMHAESLSQKERMHVADLEDRRQQREFDLLKEQMKQQQFQTEAQLKIALGSGV